MVNIIIIIQKLAILSQANALEIMSQITILAQKKEVISHFLFTKL
jgi:hypothetical protein